MYPSEYLLKLWKGISYPVKVTFASSVAIGIVVHLFMITNMLPNHDSLHVIFGFHWLISQGRWFATVPGFLSTDYLLPWNTGLLIILYSAVSSCLVIKCFRVNDGLHCVLISGLMVSFPTVVCTLLYYADFLTSALPLACLGVYITQRFRYGFCAGFIFIACSLACYQAYFSVAAALSVGILIIDIIQANLSLKELLLKGIKLFFTLLLGIIAYFIIVKLSLAITQRQLSAYQGISEMGKISISTIPHQIKQAYVSIFDFFIRDNYNLHGSVLKYLFFVIIIISIIILLVIIVQKKIYKRKSHFFILLLLVILYPLACNIVYIMNPSVVYLNMIYGMVFSPIAVIALMELIKNKIAFKEMYFIFLFKRIACWGISAVFAICIYNYGLLANKTYTARHISYEQGYAYSVELVTRIESADGYTNDIPILLVGKPGETINPIPSFNELRGIYSASSQIPGAYSYTEFIRNFLGFRTGMVLAGGGGRFGYNHKI
jgi:hypothetical protein